MMVFEAGGEGTEARRLQLGCLEKRRAGQREEKTRERRGGERGFRGPAARSLQSAACSFWTRRQLNCIERNGTGLQVEGLAGLAALDGIGFEFEEGSTPQMAASPSGGRGGERLAGWRVQMGANAQVRVGPTASTCRMIWVPKVLEATIKWSLNCAKGSTSLAAPAAPATLDFQGSQASARPRAGDGRRVAGSPEQALASGRGSIAEIHVVDQSERR